MLMEFFVDSLYDMVQYLQKFISFSKMILSILRAAGF